MLSAKGNGLSKTQDSLLGTYAMAERGGFEPPQGKKDDSADAGIVADFLQEKKAGD